MKLAALYLSDHAYLNNEFDMINFGGRYNYSLSAALPLTVTRRPNEQFIDRFFDISESKISLENVSAIVGQNGVGKSTLLDSIRRNFIENTYALPRASSFMLIEDGETVFYYSAAEFDLYLLKGLISSPIERLRKTEFQTIYYSPHFDLRFNPNFDEVDYFDISLDKYIDLDLQDLEYRGTNEQGMAYPVKQELLFKNAMRQIHFMDSDLVKNGVFKKYFSFPPHGRAVMTIRETKYEKSLRNVPRAFLSALEKLQKKIEDELNDWTNVRILNDKHNVDNQLDIDRYLLKRNLLHDLLSVLIRQMDISNSYLSEAEFDQHHFDVAENNSAFDYFKAFLESCSIYTAKGPQHPFDVTLISQLIDEIYRAADRIDHSDLLKQQELKVSAVDAIKILQLQREVIADISNYYNKQVRQGSKDYDRLNYLVPDFVLYAPAEKQLSSGENALLNFFSRLYAFMQNKLRPEYNSKPDIKTFLILLDEADAGFHPVWKKKFVYALAQTLPFFFEKYKQKPSIQILFTTHDPLTLSDLPRANVICLFNDEGKVKMVAQDKLLPTFGANITDLLADSFFIEDGLIGDFARHKIGEAVQWLESDSKEKADAHKKLIDLIDEPIVKRKLAEMYDDKMQDDFELSMIDKQIAELQEIRKLKSK